MSAHQLVLRYNRNIYFPLRDTGRFNGRPQAGQSRAENDKIVSENIGHATPPPPKKPSNGRR
jgi:hypothetical protein